MIKIENVEVVGWGPSIRGMRNPMNSWAKSDSKDCPYPSQFWGKCADCDPKNKDKTRSHCIGPNDYDLMMRLANGGPVHAKYRRFIDVYLDITAPFYWWKEFRTYRRGVKYMDEDRSFEYPDDVLYDFIEMNSCSTMHKIHESPFTVNDFSCEKLGFGTDEDLKPHYKHFCLVLDSLNNLRDLYNKTKDKKYWYAMILMLPSSYNQKRTLKLNYEVLAAMYEFRRNHKQDEWREFCKWIESLPYSEIITGGIKNEQT